MYQNELRFDVTLNTNVLCVLCSQLSNIIMSRYITPNRQTEPEPDQYFLRHLGDNVYICCLPPSL